MATAFITAARHRFPDSWAVGDVIRFVGEIRARRDGENDLLDPGQLSRCSSLPSATCRWLRT
jgi:hypothetical protein